MYSDLPHVDLPPEDQDVFAGIERVASIKGSGWGTNVSVALALAISIALARRMDKPLINDALRRISSSRGAAEKLASRFGDCGSGTAVEQRFALWAGSSHMMRPVSLKVGTGDFAFAADHRGRALAGAPIPNLTAANA
jgi:hypothetical protein